MKRTALLFSLLLSLLWQGAMAQGPLPARVSHDNAARFVKQYPQYSDQFAFQKDGSAYCAEQNALNAFLKFERDNGMSSTLAASIPVAERKEAVASPNAVICAGTKGAIAVNDQTSLTSVELEIKAIEDQLAGRPADPTVAVAFDAQTSLEERHQQLLALREKLITKK